MFRSDGKENLVLNDEERETPKNSPDAFISSYFSWEFYHPFSWQATKDAKHHLYFADGELDTQKVYPCAYITQLGNGGGET